VYGVSRLKLGLFGANCSSGRAITLVPESWTGPFAAAAAAPASCSGESPALASGIASQ
jgi:hypothetical protein